MEWKSLQRYWIREWENTQEEDFRSILANLSTNVSGGTHGGHNSGTGSHSHKVVMPKLKPGDRVLIVWVEGEPVVVDVVVKASGL